MNRRFMRPMYWASSTGSRSPLDHMGDLDGSPTPPDVRQPWLAPRSSGLDYIGRLEGATKPHGCSERHGDAVVLDGARPRARAEGEWLGRFSGVCPEIVVAVGLRETGGHFPAMEEIAHDPVCNCPIIAVHAMMVGAQPGFAGELKATRCAKAHAAQQ